MARYIDADELYKATQKRIAEANEARMAVVDDEFLDLINDAFTEDVAPRAELAREIFEEIAQIKKEYASGDIDGDTLYAMLHLLEKKYMEENHERKN